MIPTLLRVGAPLMPTAPTIEAEVTFLTRADGGRSAPPDLSTGGSTPRLVVQPPDVRVAVYENGFGVEPYLGVVVLDGPARPTPGLPIRVTLPLGYCPDVDYGALCDGTTFTVREGGRVVGYGTVVRGHTGLAS